ncbi:hypothetical protein PC129_g7940 [Phytophthora cactorum]|uniref:Uncharacterized protein n=1 Tax=Phytophthora cactorum TaxID=29920 RepID=A0A8T0ZB47_9STRA|nr:hypothetical protein PC112_g9375 [Phytophthora cactorum]KAG3087718.1 hypothetical protein PI125_g18575 [Phytophthora idaei]KAG2835061.1 hypothetical protein PC111_g5605 [Phytophthora cactorum]KAG2859520.1 hypothetical protein PC113_g8865 [Phytophthora cactorum]KAG2911378.1 hypothetical protein PC114_g9392 [Phytophthora cactorum]
MAIVAALRSAQLNRRVHGPDPPYTNTYDLWICAGRMWYNADYQTLVYSY